MIRSTILVAAVVAGALTPSGVAANEVAYIEPQSYAATPCENTFPETVVGAWQPDPARASRVGASTQALDPAVDLAVDPAVDTVAATATPLIFTEDAWSVTIPHLGALSYPYVVIGGNLTDTLMELRHESGATAVVTVRFVECGIALQTEGDCGDFCDHVRGDLLALLKAKLGDNIDASAIKLNPAGPTNAGVWHYYRRLEGSVR